MKLEKLPFKKRHCKKCQDPLEEDWMYDECDNCLLDAQKKSRIIKGTVIGGTALVLGSIAGLVFYKYKKK